MMYIFFLVFLVKNRYKSIFGGFFFGSIAYGGFVRGGLSEEVFSKGILPWWGFCPPTQKGIIYDMYILILKTFAI